jgi:hypothetical protein
LRQFWAWNHQRTLGVSLLFFFHKLKPALLQSINMVHGTMLIRVTWYSYEFESYTLSCYHNSLPPSLYFKCHFSEHLWHCKLSSIKVHPGVTTFSMDLLKSTWEEEHICYKSCVCDSTVPTTPGLICGDKTSEPHLLGDNHQT